MCDAYFASEFLHKRSFVTEGSRDSLSVPQTSRRNRSRTRIRCRQRTSERSSPRVSAMRSRLRGWGLGDASPPVHRTLDGASQGNLAALRTIPERESETSQAGILDAAPRRRAPAELPIDRKLECCGEDPNESDRVHSGIGESRRCQLVAHVESVRLQLSDVSGDLGFSSGENRAACHNIRLDIRVIIRESREPYGVLYLASAFAPRLFRPCRDRVLELTTLGYHQDATSACIGDASTGWLLLEKSTAIETTGGGSHSVGGWVSSRGALQSRSSPTQLTRESTLRSR